MRIGVDLCDLDPAYSGGVNSFAFGLLAGLLKAKAREDRIVLLATPRNGPFLRQTYGAEAEVVELPYGGSDRRVDSALVLASWLVRTTRLRLWFDRVFRAGILRRIEGAADVLVAPLSVLRFPAARIPAILSIHDIQQDYHPEFFTWRQRVARWAPYRLSAARAARIQASSTYIRDCLVEKFNTDPARIVVIAEGVDRTRFSPDAPSEPPPSISQPLIFYPAQIWPHKNHLLLVEALALYRERTGAEISCVLTGADYGQWATVAQAIAEHGLSQVHYLGRVPMAQLLWLYRNCLAVLALGLHESSSLPVREGAAFGKVLIAMDIPPNREVQGSLNVQITSNDAGALAGLIAAVVQDQDGIVAAGHENARLVARFDWTVIAGEYLAVLKQLAPK